jgi:hypothetical protein
MAIDFPSTGLVAGVTTYTVGSKTWVWNGTAWDSTGTQLVGTAPISYSNGTISLATSGVTANTYNNSATAITPLTIDTYGRITATGAAVTITPAWGSITSIPAQLTGIAGLLSTGTGLIKNTAGTWSYDTNTYLTANQSITLSGDVSGSGTTAITVTLGNSGATAGTYNNSATTVTPFTIDVKGRITGTSAAVTITPAWSSITTVPAQLTGIIGLSSTGTGLLKNTAGVWSYDTNAYITGSSPTINNLTLTGTLTAGASVGTNGQVLQSTGTGVQWATAASGGVSSFSAGSTGLTPNTATTGAITLAGTLAVANGGTGTGIAGISAFNNITGYTAAGASGTTSTNLVFSTSPTITTPVIDTINTSLTTTGTAALWNTGLTTGTIQIGGAVTTTGIITLGGTAAGSSGTVNILTGATTSGTKTINIGTSGTTGSTTTINIGTTGGTTPTIALNGSTTVNGTLTTTSTIDASAGVTSFFATPTSITLGAAATTVNEYNTTSALTLNIATGAGANNKTISIGTAATGGTTAITIGSSSGATSTVTLNGTINTTSGSFKVGNTSLAQGVTGTITFPGTAGTLALNPTTTAGDLIYASVTGTPGTLARLAPSATNGYVLTYDTTLNAPKWAASTGGGMTNPMTTAGDIIYGGASGTPTRLAGSGTNNYVLTYDTSLNAPKWAATSGGGGTSVTTSTISTNTANTVDTVALSGFTTIEYTLSIKQGTKVRSSKVYVQTDGTNVDYSEYAIMQTGAVISGIQVVATTSSTNMVLQITITDASTTNATVKFAKVTM